MKFLAIWVNKIFESMQWSIFTALYQIQLKGLIFFQLVFLLIDSTWVLLCNITINQNLLIWKEFSCNIILLTLFTWGLNPELLRKIFFDPLINTFVHWSHVERYIDDVMAINNSYNINGQVNFILAVKDSLL